MADNIWDNSDADNDGNVAANWSLNQVPTGTDVAVFDSGTTDASCLFSGAISCAGMRFDNAYAGTVDAATFPSLSASELSQMLSAINFFGVRSAATLDVPNAASLCRRATTAKWAHNPRGGLLLSVSRQSHETPPPNQTY